jgi:hypothetical protein
VITAVLDLQKQPQIAARGTPGQDPGAWLAGSPLVEIVFDDKDLMAAASAG